MPGGEHRDGPSSLKLPLRCWLGLISFRLLGSAWVSSEEAEANAWSQSLWRMPLITSNQRRESRGRSVSNVRRVGDMATPGGRWEQEKAPGDGSSNAAGTPGFPGGGGNRQTCSAEPSATGEKVAS